MTDADICRDRGESEDSYREKYESNILSECCLWKQEKKTTDKEKYPSLWFVLETDEKYSCESEIDQYSIVSECLYLLFYYHC